VSSLARILIIHSERSARRFLEAAASRHHDVNAVSDLATGVHALNKQRPALIVAGIDLRKKEALELLRAMKRSGTRIPTIVVGGSGTGAMQPALMKLGAAAFLEYPLEPVVLDAAISKALQNDVEARGQFPPICREEAEANLTELEEDLNRRMQCFAGKNLVHIRSVIVGQLRKTKPRISLKCPLRKEAGLTPTVYYEYIRDVCCADPNVCPAYQAFRARQTI
jgi:DNA-binding response OmpR family regulator